MKKIVLSLLAATALFSSCSKDDDNGTYVSNTWMVNGIVHSVVNNLRLGGNFTIHVNDGNTDNGNGLTFVFSSAPKSGSYTIVDFPTQPNEVSVFATEGNLLNTYRSTTAETRKVLLEVDGAGRATIYMEGAMLQNALNAEMTAEVSASIRENQ